MEVPQGMELSDGAGINAAVRPGMQTPVSLISICPDIGHDIDMIDEDEDCEDVGDDDDEWEDYEEEDEDVENGCVEGRIEPEMVDGFIHGEENRQFKSKVWGEFIKVRQGGVVVKGKCKNCNVHITAKRGSGTSAMGNHLKRCKLRKGLVHVTNQLNAAIMSPEGVSLKEWRFNQDVSRRELVRMIVLHELSFSIVEYDGFRRFVSSLNPHFKMSSRRTITIDCLKAFEEHRQVLREVLENSSSRVSLTMDMWTSNQTIGYLCITCHCIDADWKMHKRILKFCFLKSPHTGVAMFNAVLKSIQDWKIEDKVFAITLDNASNNTSMIKHLKKNLLEKQMLVGKGKLLHQRCAAHVLNLICQAGFQVLNSIIHKIRESVKYIQGSPARKQKLDEIVQQLGIKCKARPNLDVITRWNSTYLMVADALEYKRAFESLQLQDPKYSCAPSLQDWERAQVVCPLLKVFYNATKVISGSLYPTANLFFHELWEVKVALDSKACDENSDLFEIVEYMQKKFKKYWKLMWLHISISVILDPRFKQGFIEFRLTQACGSEAASNIAIVKKVFLNLFNDYSQLNTASQEATEQPIQTEVAANASGRYADWDSHMSRIANLTREVPSELEIYLKKSPIPCGGQFDILAWWKSNSLEYPTLSRMARDILVVPASTVASESAFSTGGRVISDFRSRLTPETMEALVCLQDWMRASGSKLLMEAIHDFIELADEQE